MTALERLHIEPRHVVYSIGYSLTSVWATLLLFSSSFSNTASFSIVSMSMLAGLVACLGTLFFGTRLPAFDGRSTAASVYATAMAAGTLLCTFPSLAENQLVHDVGVVLSGFFAILLILTWFEVFAGLSARLIVFLAGIALLFSAVACLGVLACPPEVASVIMAALPLASFFLLPRSSGRQGRDATVARPLLSVVREAVSWKTLLGVVVSFFVIGAFGELAPQLGMSVSPTPVTLVVPAVIAGFFVVSALVAPTRIDASLFYKLLLVGLALLAFLFVYRGANDLSLIFFVYITADVLLWCVLALAAKRTPVPAHYVFAVGWLAECAGNVAGHNVAHLMGSSTELFVLVILLVIVGVGFAFGDGLFVLELEDAQGLRGPAAHEPALDATSHNAQVAPTSAATPAAPATPDDPDDPGDLTDVEEGMPDPYATQETAIASFVEEYALSTREAEVFSAWVTGHGLKYIQDTLYISESTVKTHLRSIYRKCGVHNRAEIIDLFERGSR